MSFEIGPVFKSHPHLLADLAEIILLTSYDDSDSLSQASLELLTKELPIDSNEIDELSDSYIDDASTNDLIDQNIEDCWTQLEYRASVYGNYYPFQIIGEQLAWKPGKRTQEECLYVFLLICSRLRSFKIKGFSQRAAKIFAKLSRQALVAIVGNKAEVRIFDANSDDRRNYFGTDLRHAMKKLANDLAAHNVTIEEIDKLSPQGDEGIDLVAIHKFSDGATGSFAIFGQCASQERNWPTKTLEANPIRLAGLFHCLHAPSNFVFIPVNYRTSSGDWVQSSKTSGCLLIDRLRIIELVKDRWESTRGLLVSDCYPILSEVVHVARSID